MRKFMCTLFAAVVLAFYAPYANADSITDGTLNFTVTSGGPAPTGSFTLDNTTSTFTSFTVDWDGAVFNFAPFFNGAAGPFLTSEYLLPGKWCAAGPSAISFALQAGNCAPWNFTLGLEVLTTGPTVEAVASFADPFAGASGTYTLTETAAATPEPNSLVLVLAGLGTLTFVVSRRRIRFRNQGAI